MAFDRSAFRLVALWTTSIRVIALSDFGVIQKHGVGFDVSGQNTMAANISVADPEFPEKHIFPRECEQAAEGYVPCSNVPGRCCKSGQDCFAGSSRVVCCPHGEIPCGNKCYDPAKAKCCSVDQGEWPCPSGTDCCGAGFCYTPSSQVCCNSGPCNGAQNKICCDKQCCNPAVYASCDSSGNCARATCAETSTRTPTETVESTTRRTVREIITVYDAEAEEGSSLPQFQCPPATFNNTDTPGTSLELGDNCKLTLHVDLGATSTPAAERRAMADPTSADLRRRADLICTATATTTSTLLVVSTITSNSTTTLAPTSLNFDCIPVVVTDVDGDELALGDDCSLEYTPADSTSSDDGFSSSTSDDYNPNFPATITVVAAPEPEATTASSSSGRKAFPILGYVIFFPALMILAAILI